ncbi:hypothetical protein OS493_033133 [Desmophyllum pertusum]|uniref:Galactosylceramide sulfotransferase-like n=1 Tax=Desmophyllum pertusum TaxID=174260 RepID=A0A9W9YIY8_9CNID|nr:hypothetical protein OS493_033133 [Desmophyllum pertusum]
MNGRQRRSISTPIAVLQKNITATDEFPARLPSCQPINHIYFLKTHKTASSTIATMLLSYGINRNHTIVLDPDLAEMEWPALLKLNEVSSLVQSEEAKIFSTHIRFNKGPINSVFPKRSAKYITIIRNPIDRFKSAWIFYNFQKHHAGISNNNDALTSNTFLKSTNALQDIQDRLAETKVDIFNHISNSNLFDMGLEQEDIQNMTLVKSYIDIMDREFDLVMITDYFDESLILLKRLLCWEFEDIVYIKLRVTSKRLELEEEVKKNILTWNHADGILFDHFNKTFWRNILQAGSTFYEDLKAFRRINQEYKASCGTMKDKMMSIKQKNSLLENKCALSKRNPCNILEQLWRKRGNSFSGGGCGPNPSHIASHRLLNSELN